MTLSGEQKAAGAASGAPDLESAEGGLFGFAWLNQDLGWLFVLRALRSISQGYLGIILPLYLAILGYNAVALGTLLAVSAIAAAITSTLTGVLADRFGRKTFIVLISLMFTVGGVGFAFARSFFWIVAFAAIGSIGRGGALAGGAWAPFYPAVQALVAEQSSHENRTTIFGVFSFVGVMAGALGSLLAALPSVLKHTPGLPEVQSYGLLFILSGVLGAAMAVAVIPVRERHVPSAVGPSDLKQPGTAHSGTLRLGLSRKSWRLVIRFMITNSTNGLAIGMLGPMVVYWFYRRFGASSVELAEVFFIINFLSAIPYLAAGRIALTWGSVRSVVVTRSVSTVLLFAVVIMPSFAWAAALYGVRALFNVLSIPVRQSYLMGVIDPAERSSASGFANFPSQVTSAIGPYMAGYFMEHLALALPLEFAAVMQGLNTFLYWAFFRNVYPPEEGGGKG
ncbi:MAG TPA: MFS transporter [Candidatus Binataceae bacterium]|nr:MFS transporter [Candidatus Binataceae bacterium]